LANRNIKTVLCSYPVLINYRNVNQYPSIFWDNRRFNIELSFFGIIDATIQFNDVIREIAIQYKIPYIDVDGAVSNDTINFGDNVHYTDKGSRAVAKAVGAKLLWLALHDEK
jgi:lysophospholipase L1-like esterase